MVNNIAGININNQNNEQKKHAQNLDKKKKLGNDAAVLNTGYLNEMYNSLIIPSDESVKSFCINDKVYLKENKSDKDYKKIFKATCLASFGLTALIAGCTGIIKASARNKVKNAFERQLPELPRNICLNDEKIFATYMAIQNPSMKTLIGVTGVFGLGFIGLIAKNFIDGFKSIWVKKQEAKTQIELQNKLIEVETNSFAGKVQIQRDLMSKCAKKFEHVLESKDNKHKRHAKSRIDFKAGEKDIQAKQSGKDNIFYFGLGGITLCGMGFMAYITKKNLKDADKYYKQFQSKLKDTVSAFIKNVGDETTSLSLPYEVVEKIKNRMVTLAPDNKEIDSMLEPLRSKMINKGEFEKFKSAIKHEVRKISDTASEAIAGKPGNKATFYSHVDDLRGHFYNWIVNDCDPTLGFLFLAMMLTTSLGYIGLRAIEAVRETGVIKANAKTELDMQKQLVDVELRSYRAKKNTAITPLMEEFDKKSSEGKDIKDLKIMAENILMEIKNGPPYIFT